MRKLEDDILYRRLQLMFACMDDDNDGYIWPNDFVHAMTYFGLASEGDRMRIVRDHQLAYHHRHHRRRTSTFAEYPPSEARPPPVGGMDFDEFKVEVLELDREDKLRRSAREALNQRTQTHAKLASMAENTAIKMVLAFTILFVSSIYLFNDSTSTTSEVGLVLVDSLYRYGGVNQDTRYGVLEMQSRLLLASIPDRYMTVYFQISSIDGPWVVDRLDE
ncbi:Nitrogen permease regulator 2, partial [Perkinsus olseni]